MFSYRRIRVQIPLGTLINILKLFAFRMGCSKLMPAASGGVCASSCRKGDGLIRSAGLHLQFHHFLAEAVPRERGVDVNDVSGWAVGADPQDVCSRAIDARETYHGPAKVVPAAVAQAKQLQIFDQPVP